jgi:hypothetical protein
MSIQRRSLSQLIGTAISKHWPGLSTITLLIQAASAEETLDCDRSGWSALSDDGSNKAVDLRFSVLTPRVTFPELPQSLLC